MSSCITVSFSPDKIPVYVAFLLNQLQDSREASTEVQKNGTKTFDELKNIVMQALDQNLLTAETLADFMVWFTKKNMSKNLADMLTEHMTSLRNTRRDTEAKHEFEGSNRRNSTSTKVSESNETNSREKGSKRGMTTDDKVRNKAFKSSVSSQKFEGLPKNVISALKVAFINDDYEALLKLDWTTVIEDCYYITTPKGAKVRVQSLFTLMLMTCTSEICQQVLTTLLPSLQLDTGATSSMLKKTFSDIVKLCRLEKCPVTENIKKLTYNCNFFVVPSILSKYCDSSLLMIWLASRNLIFGSPKEVKSFLNKFFTEMKRDVIVSYNINDQVLPLNFFEICFAINPKVACYLGGNLFKSDAGLILSKSNRRSCLEKVKRVVAHLAIFEWKEDDTELLTKTFNILDTCDTESSNSKKHMNSTQKRKRSDDSSLESSKAQDEKSNVHSGANKNRGNEERKSALPSWPQNDENDDMSDDGVNSQSEAESDVDSPPPTKAKKRRVQQKEAQESDSDSDSDIDL